MICAGKSSVTAVNTAAAARQIRIIMVIARLSEAMSLRPQNCAVSTAAPPPMPMQRMWNILMKSFARDDPESCISPYEPSITVSIMFTPMVIMFWSTTGSASITAAR